FAAPAAAQYSNEYYPPKLAHQGKTAKPIAGTGKVIVQVQVNANGSHKVIRVIKSTNSADNAAALDIAGNSSYKPATRGSKSVTAYYDFTLKFTGRTVASANAGGGTSNFKGVAGQIDGMIRKANYAGAKARAQTALQSNPDDPTLNSELGAANYFMNDLPAAAAAFSKVSSLNPEFKQVAANAYMQAATKLVSSNASLALAYAQRAVALSPGGGSYYALGSAELASGNAAQAATDLKRARDAVFGDPKADVKSRVNVDAQLYAAYNQAGETAQAAATMDEVKKLDPNNPALSTIQANTYIAQGQALQKAGKFDEAIAAFLQAAAVNNPAAQVTGNLSAAFALSSKLSQKDAKPTVADYKTMQGYADKALALRPSDPQANFAEGIALAGQYLVGGKSDASLKTRAMAALNKAKSQAQSAGNMSLSIAVDNFIKQSLPQ
ncbi:MAG: TonB family protein, partial [Candidatus Baltobacteraceae bacterium]